MVIYANAKNVELTLAIVCFLYVLTPLLLSLCCNSTSEQRDESGGVYSATRGQHGWRVSPPPTAPANMSLTFTERAPERLYGLTAGPSENTVIYAVV